MKRLTGLGFLLSQSTCQTSVGCEPLRSCPRDGSALARPKTPSKGIKPLAAMPSKENKMKKLINACMPMFIAVMTFGSVLTGAPSAASALTDGPSNAAHSRATVSASPIIVPQPKSASSVKEARVIEAINRSYVFRERSEAVAVLQRLLGNVSVDGYYGSQTRAAHLRALEIRKMSTAHVPAVSYPASSGPRIPSDPEMRCPRWEAKFREFGLPVEVFSYIAWRESRCNPKAINARWNSKGEMTYHLNGDGTWDSGLVQINSSWIRTVRDVCDVDSGSMRQDLAELLNVNCNLKMAKWIMDNTSGKLRNWRVYGG